MSQENMEIVRTIHDALQRGESPTSLIGRVFEDVVASWGSTGLIDLYRRDSSTSLR
jgi:hypothetical protein